MKTTFLLLFGAAMCSVSLVPLSAQQPVPSATPGVEASQPLQRRIQQQVTIPPNAAASQRAPVIPLLSRNYLLRIRVTEGEKVTEYKLVTAASAIRISTPGGSDGARSASIDGQIDESDEGSISVALMMSLAVPEPASVQPGGAPQPGRGQGQSESFTASVRAKLSVEYTLFATAARTYHLTITPQEGEVAAPTK